MGSLKKICRNTFTVLMACFLAFTGTLTNFVQVRASNKTAAEYEIYPIPHDISYEDGETSITQNVNVVYEEQIDAVTKKRANEIIASINSNTDVTQAVVADKTNLLVGVYNSNGYVDTYVKENYGIDPAIFDKIDANVVISDQGTLIVLGKDSDAAFYGLTSLKHIFKQLENKMIQDFTIKDYADTETRGFIEGYYGPPWSDEDRMSLMKFGGDFKMNMYLFAPKDDPYHKSSWRTLYPAERLEEIKEMVQAGIDSKCRFNWTIHPFGGNGINESNYDASLGYIKAKFEQLYSVGVRNFGVLGDDAGNLPYSLLIRLMEDLETWKNDKGDVGDFYFCMAGYNTSWQNAFSNYAELNALDAGYPDNVNMFWTGTAVCTPISQLALDGFRRTKLQGTTDRRKPTFWLNWPVNDVNINRLMMGKGSLLQPDINIDDLQGVVTNPMQDAEASKVAIFAVADYSWNIKSFNDDVSWEDSFKYIDEDATEELHTLAKHMSDPAPNGHGLVLGESEDLKPLLDEFTSKLSSDDDITTIGQQLIDEFQIIMDACDAFQAKSKNEALKDELLPFTGSLNELAEAAIYYIKTALALHAGDNNAVWTNYSQAIALMDASTQHIRIGKDGALSAYALPGSKRIRPFAEKLGSMMSAEVGSILDPTKIIVNPITNREDSPIGGIESINDGDKATAAVFKTPNTSKAGEYIGLSFNNPVHLNNVAFYMGNSGNTKDSFSLAKLQYTLDGKEWIDLNDQTYANTAGDIRVDGLDLNVKGIRIIAVQDTENIWVSCREIVYNEKDDEEDPNIIPNTMFVTPGYTSYSGALSNITDRNDSTFVWFQMDGNSSNAGDYIGVDLGEPVLIGNIHFAVGGTSANDYWTNYDLEYSLDGKEYTKLESYTQSSTKKVSDFDATRLGITAQYVRLKNTVTTGKWVQISELHVDKASTLTAYTNSEACKSIIKFETLDKTSLNNTNDVTLKPNEYVGVELSRIKDLTEINTIHNDKLTLESSPNGFVWTTVADKNQPDDAKYVRLINKTDADVTFDLTVFEVSSREVMPKSLYSSNMGIPANPLDVFDKDRTTSTQFASSQIIGRNFVYDFGQVIDLDSFKVVLNDGEWDFPRHGKFSVSEDGTNWTDIMYLGNQDGENEGESEDLDNINDVLPDHEISYNTKETRDINQKARYLKFEITRTKVGTDKWIRFNEFEINDGAYIPSENDPTITTTAPIVDGKEPKNIIDDDVSTVFTPGSNKAGELVYNITKNPDLSRITILQSPASTSNADVYVLAPTKARSTDFSWQKIGSLDASLNQYSVKAFGLVLAIKIVWAEDTVPTINEIFTLESSSTIVDKTTLLEAIEAAKAIDAALYTIDSYNALHTKLIEAQEVYDLETATNEQVMIAESALKNAISNLLKRADTTALEEEIKKSDQLIESSYTDETWAIYQTALDAAKEAVKDNSNVSEAMAASLLKDLKAAYDGLKEDTTLAKKLLFSAITKANAADETGQLDKLAPSVAALIRSQRDAAVEVYNNGNANNEQCLTAWMNLADALHYLDFVADKSLLLTLITSCEDIDIEDYKDGVEEYLGALQHANDVYNNPKVLQDTINKAYKRLETAISNLVENDKVDKTLLQTMVDNIKMKVGDGSKYKDDQSWTDFETAMANAIRVLDDKKATQLEVNEAMNTLADAYMNIRLKPDEALLEQLNSFIRIANEIDRSLYTNDQLAYIDGVVADANAMLNNFDETSLANLQNKITKALNIINNEQRTKPITKPAVDTTKPSAKTPDTSDSTNMALLWSLVLGAGVTALEIKRRKRNKV